MLAADEEMTTAIRESRHESCTAEEEDHIHQEREKFSLLAKPFKQKPAQRGVGNPCHSGNNHDDDEDDRGSRPGGPRPHTYNLAALTTRKKETLARFPFPTRNGQGPRGEDAEMEEGGEDSDVEIVDESLREEVEETGGETFG